MIIIRSDVAKHRPKPRLRRVLLPILAGLIALIFGFGINAYIPLIKVSGKFLRYAESQNASGKVSLYPLFEIDFPQGTRVVKAASVMESVAYRQPDKIYPLLCMLGQENGQNKITRVRVLDNYFSGFFYVLFPCYGFIAFASLFFMAAYVGWRESFRMYS